MPPALPSSNPSARDGDSRDLSQHFLRGSNTRPAPCSRVGLVIRGFASGRSPLQRATTCAVHPSVRPVPRTKSFQFSLLTDRAPEEVLSEFAGRSLPGIAVAERGRNYIILRPRRRHRYGGDIAVGLAIGITLIVLM